MECYKSLHWTEDATIDAVDVCSVRGGRVCACDVAKKGLVEIV